MSDIIENLSNQINIDKEVLSALPKNNKKNVQLYKDKAGEIRQEYMSLLSNISAEIKRRAVKINSISVNPKIVELTEEIKKMEDIHNLSCDATPFEKMKLDETLYILKRFYKNNLEFINNSILKCIEMFKNVDITLEVKDFNYSIYTKEYMETFLEETKKGDSNSQKVKETFEQIYWKCPDIILHIELNFRSLYLKNEKQIINNCEIEEKKILKQLGLNRKEAQEKIVSLKLKLKDLTNKDTYTIINDFKDGNKSVKEYEYSYVEKNYKKLIGTIPAELEKDPLDEYNENIEKLANSLYEYKNYLKYKFIYDEVIAILNDKQKYKKTYLEKRKLIQKKEKKLFKGNRKIERNSEHTGLFSKLFAINQNKLDKINVDINEQVLELKQIYKELEESKIKNIILENLTESSTIYDVFKLASCFYSFLVDIIIKQFEGIEQDQIINFVEEYRNFVNNTNVTVINNQKIADSKEIALVIKDKYKLYNINLEKGDFSEDNLEGIISSTNNICVYNYILGSKVSINDIKFLLEAKKIIEE